MKTRLAMIGAKLCRECLKWQDVIDRILDPNNLRIGGIQYFVREDIPDPPHAAEEMVLKDDGELIITKSLVRLGRVPEHFADRLADNAVFVQDLEGEPS
jgi:hypothetical protein